MKKGRRRWPVLSNATIIQLTGSSSNLELPLKHGELVHAEKREIVSAQKIMQWEA